MVTSKTDIISDIIAHEGGFVNDKNDRGGRTMFGITEASNPEAWRDGKVTIEEARDIYEKKYVAPFKTVEGHIAYSQMVDFGVTSGPGLVIQKVQGLVGVDIDGQLGTHTLAAIAQVDPLWLNNHLMVSRMLMIGRLVQKNPSQLKFLSGWLIRASEFLL